MLIAGQENTIRLTNDSEIVHVSHAINNCVNVHTISDMHTVDMYVGNTSLWVFKVYRDTELFTLDEGAELVGVVDTPEDIYYVYVTR